MRRTTPLYMAIICSICLTSCSKPQTAAKQPPAIIACPKIANNQTNYFCPSVRSIQPTDDGKFMVTGRLSANWKISDPEFVTKPLTFYQAVFTGTSEGKVTCTYTSAGSNQYTQISFTNTILRPCKKKWQAYQSSWACAPSNHDIRECPFNLKNPINA